MTDYFELTIIANIHVSTRYNDGLVIWQDHVHDLYRGPLVSDYDEQTTALKKKLFDNCHQLEKIADDDVIISGTINIVSPFLTRPIRKRVYYKDDRLRLFE